MLSVHCETKANASLGLGVSEMCETANNISSPGCVTMFKGASFREVHLFHISLLNAPDKIALSKRNIHAYTD